MLYVYVGIFSITFVCILYDDEEFQNYWTLCTYLLPLGWVPCFALGIGKISVQEKEFEYHLITFLSL